MNDTSSKQSLGGQAVAKKYGSEYMSRLGKKGRKKQLKATRSTTESNAHQKENGDTPNTSTKGGDGSPVTV